MFGAQDDGSTEGDVNGDLPESVRDLVRAVRERAARSPSTRDIRALADEKTKRAKGDPVTLAQIGELADAAVRRAEKVTALMSRLAELTGSAHEGA